MEVGNLRMSHITIFQKREHGVETERFRVLDGSRPEGHVPRFIRRRFQTDLKPQLFRPGRALTVGVCLTCERHTH